jgi:hypothetical protein
MEKYVDLIKWMNERDQKNVLKKNMKVMWLMKQKIIWLII